MLQIHAFPAGGRQIDAVGNFFRYESCTSGGLDETIRVKADGNDLGTFLPGDWVRLPVQAKRWEISAVTPAAYGAVRVGLGDVGSSRLTGSVRVLDEISDNLVHVNGNASTAVAALAYTQIASPASNVAGMVVRGVGLIIQPGAGGDIQMIWTAAKTAPIGQATPTARLNFKKIYQSTSGGVVNSNDFNLNKLLPAGWGLFVGVEVTGAPALVASYSCAYELR